MAETARVVKSNCAPFPLARIAYRHKNMPEVPEAEKEKQEKVSKVATALGLGDTRTRHAYLDGEAGIVELGFSWGPLGDGKKFLGVFPNFTDGGAVFGGFAYSSWTRREMDAEKFVSISDWKDLDTLKPEEWCLVEGMYQIEEEAEEQRG